MKTIILTAAVLAAASCRAAAPKPPEKPAGRQNVILVITDDQGYGDFGFTGNPAIKTPAIDRLRSQGVLLDNFHVDPTCAPSRAALMTGRYSGRVGVWSTVQGRSILREREVTMADVFRANGYATGMFGKWHLGDSYPYRPRDRGFRRAVYHAGGGVGQEPDYWGNDYFDDTYIVDGEFRRMKGFCTDVWFREGMKFIKENKDRPFFVYLATNAAHEPFRCPPEFSAPYRDDPRVPNSVFYGMIANIDANMSKLLDLLDREGLADNTILVFMTDNGTSGGVTRERGYNGNMRGRKGSVYEGGHRVPLIMRWPNGKLKAGGTVARLTAHIDILPTLIDLCGLKAPDAAFDGASIRRLLFPDGRAWPERKLVVESQWGRFTPVKWRGCSVMTDSLRLVNGEELYDLAADPGQTKNIAEDRPQKVRELREVYEAFWSDVSRGHGLISPIHIGSDREPIVKLCSFDWLSDRIPPWSQSQVRNGRGAAVSSWAVEAERDGAYEISLRRWPAEADKGINDGTYGKAFRFKTACLRIGDVNRTAGIPEGAKEVTFKVFLKKGSYRLSPYFAGDTLKATPYYAYVTHRPFPGWQTPGGMGIPVCDPNDGQKPPPPPKPARRGSRRGSAPKGHPRQRS